MQETWVGSLGWEDPLEMEMETTPVFLPGESHEQRSLEGYSPQGHTELYKTEWLTFSLSFLFIPGIHQEHKPCFIFIMILSLEKNLKWFSATILFAFSKQSVINVIFMGKPRRLNDVIKIIHLCLVFIEDFLALFFWKGRNRGDYLRWNDWKDSQPPAPGKHLIFSNVDSYQSATEDAEFKPNSPTFILGIDSSKCSGF